MHDLMDVDENCAGGGVIIICAFEANGFNMGIDHGPLTCPIAAHFVATVDVAAFHAVGPSDVGLHGGENAFHVASVKAFVKAGQ